MRDSNGNGATITLLISCPDRHGIVATVSGFIAEDSFALGPQEL